MIKSTCPITGIDLELLAPFGERTSIRVTSLHPLLCAKPEQLAKLSPTRDKDTRLLFLALTFKLHELEFIEFCGTPEFSPQWMTQELPHLQAFVQWANINSTNIRRDILPIFRVDALTDAQNFQAWRQECQSIIATWDTMLDASIARHIKREREAAEAIINAPADMRAKLRESPRVSRANARILFVRDALESYSQCGPSLIDFYCKLLAVPHQYEVIQLQRAKEAFLDYLPDRNIEDYNDKDTILRIIDAAIVEKVGLAKMLGIGMTEEDSQLADNIRSENSEFADGRRFITTPDTNLSNAMQFFEGRKASTIPEVAIPTCEPMRADFPSELGYKIALKAWQKILLGGGV